MKLDARKPSRIPAIATVLALVVSTARAQGPAPHATAPSIEQASTYVSQADEDLTIRKVAVLPVADNVEGIYARPVEAQLTQLVKSSHRWDFVEAGIAGSMPPMIELEENPTQVQQATRSIEADAFIGASIAKGPNGLSIRLNLFLKKDGKVLSQEILRNHARHELPEIRDQVTQLFTRMIARIPYDGLVLSRQQNRVTVNLGRTDGVSKDQVITAVQIISVNRHPKFGFIISTEKEILGRIKILKVDETLSFGTIVAEKERGAIRRLAKVAGLTQVTYAEPSRLGEGTPSGDVSSRPDSSVTFGKEPKEWLPVHPPTFGQIGMKLGLGTYDSNLRLSGAGALSAKSPLYPSLGISGEMWLTPEWTVGADLLQGVISTNNPRSRSNPGTLNHSMSYYSLEFGYNFLLRGEFFGPKLTFSGGYSVYRMYVDDSSPTSMTSMTYSGFLLGIGGSLPISDDRIWYLGGKFKYYVMASLAESPVSSAAGSKPSINAFSLTLDKKIAENIRVTGALDFNMYSANFSGTGTRTGPSGTAGATQAEVGSTTSQTHTIVSGGMVYMF